jgi:hypothetical protein
LYQVIHLGAIPLVLCPGNMKNGGIYVPIALPPVIKVKV